MRKLSFLILLIVLLLCLTACSGTEATQGIVTDKFMGEACLLRVGQLTMAKPMQTGYVLVIGADEYAVSKEQYQSVAIGDYVEI